MVSSMIMLGSSNSFPIGCQSPVPSLVLFNIASSFFFNNALLLSIPFVHTHHFILVIPLLVVSVMYQPSYDRGYSTSRPPASIYGLSRQGS